MGLKIILPVILSVKLKKPQGHRNLHASLMIMKLRLREPKGHSLHRAWGLDWDANHLALNIEVFPLHYATSQKSVKACTRKVFLAPPHRKEL